MTDDGARPRAQAEDVPPEPFPWLSTNKPTGPQRMTLKSPASEAALGLLLVVAGAVFVALLLQDPSGAAVVTAVVLFLIFGGLGSFLLIVAALRQRWANAFERVHGYRPY